MSEPKQPLPDYEDPPVIETLLGVQFSPLQSFSIIHLGLCWNQIRSEYPNQEIKPPLIPTFEEFEPQPGTVAKIGIGSAPEPDVRCWFIDPTSTQLIQVQKDRFIRNWRKTHRDQSYPRYRNLKPRFEADWGRFCAFLRKENIGSPEVNQCEVTYVNHIELGRGWESYAETYKVIRLLSPPPPSGFLRQPEIVHINTSYSLPDKRGMLHIVVQPVVSRLLGKEVLQFTLTARGKPASATAEGLSDWFDLGHEWIVRGFADLTTREMHREWGQRS